MMVEKGCESCRKWQEHYYWEHMDVRKIRFFKLMTGDFEQRIRIPDKFASNFIGQITKGFDLKAPSGETWHVGVSKVANELFFKSGWKDFAKAHELQENDTLLFTFSGNSSFEVMIFDASGCEKLSSLFADKMCKHFDDMVGQHVEQYSLSDDSDDDTSAVSPLVGSSHKTSTSKKFSGKTKQRKEPESPNSSSCDFKHESTEEEESDHDTYSDSNYYYSRAANQFTDDEKHEIIGLASMQPDNPAFVTVLRMTHVKRRDNFLIIPSAFAADHLQRGSHEILLLRPNRQDKWYVWYYQGRSTRGFKCHRWPKFVSENRLRKGDVCVFELIKGAGKKKAATTMTVHVTRRRKKDGRFVTVV